MTSTSSVEADKSKKSFLSSLLWWKTDPAEVEKQVAGYTTLRVWQSARGMSALLCLLSAGITTLIGGYIGLSTGEIAAEAIIWSTIALLMYRGYRWAFILGMILWTFEKATMIFDGTARVPIVQVIWWAIYMNAFFLAYKVESRRIAVSRAPAR